MSAGTAAGTGGLGWGGIVRLGLVQACLGAIVVLTTSTLNRVMVVELALPALLPGLLVALHYLVQISRPRMGHGSDMGARRTPWIIGGIAVLGAGAVLAALATAWMGTQRAAGIALAVPAFVLVGLGVSASGTALLVMLARHVDDRRRAGAATLVWMMMIAGFAVTAGTAGHLLDPYSPARLVAVTATVAVAALVLTVVALFRLEPAAGRAQRASEDVPGDVRGDAGGDMTPASTVVPFRQALDEVWREPLARQFTIFVFLSMLAYSAQDLILEPFAGAVFGFTPGESTRLAGVQHGGVLAGMLLVAASAAVAARWRTHALARALGSLRGWVVGGCLASAVALGALVLAGLVGPGWPLRANVFALGVANGAFSIGAIALMMRQASEGGAHRTGVRMGLWGAAQALAFGIGGLLGTGASDLTHALMASGAHAYATVFGFEAAMFVASAVLAARLGRLGRSDALRAGAGASHSPSSPPMSAAALGGRP